MSESEKSILDVSMITNLRDFENFLRSSGFARSRAKVLASRGWVTTETETQPEQMTLKRAMEMLAQVETEELPK